jgi:hypothetical protein
MRVEIGRYRNSKDFILYLWNKDKSNDHNSFVANAAVATGVPCIVVAHFLGEIIGFTPEVNAIMKRLTKFYGYTEVVE